MGTNDPVGTAIAQVGPKRLADAITSPTSLLLAGAGAGLGIAAFGFGGAVIGVVAWLIATARKLRSPSHRLVSTTSAPARIDAYTVADPWRASVIRAQNAQRRFDRTIDQASNPAIRERMDDVRSSVDAVVRKCWEVAVQGDRFDDAIRQIDVRSQAADLANAEEEIKLNRDPQRSDALTARRDSIKRQLDSANRMVALSQTTEDRLRTLTTQLDELVVRGLELSATASGTTQVDDLGSEVDAVLCEMEALRQAMNETERISAGPTAPALPTLPTTG